MNSTYRQRQNQYSQAKPKRVRNLLDILPLEVRQQIYGYALPSGNLYDLDRIRADRVIAKRTRLARQEDNPDATTYQGPVNNTGLLLVCKAIHAEAIDLLYGQNCFRIILRSKDIGNPELFWSSRNQLVKSFPGESLWKIRKVILSTNDHHWSYDRNTLDHKFWGQFFAQLKYLRVDTKNECKGWFKSCRRGVACIEGDVEIDEWTPRYAHEWEPRVLWAPKEQIIKCIGEYFPKDRYLEIEASNNDEQMKRGIEKATGSGVKVVFPKRWEGKDAVFFVRGDRRSGFCIAKAAFEAKKKIEAEEIAAEELAADEAA